MTFLMFFGPLMKVFVSEEQCKNKVTEVRHLSKTYGNYRQITDTETVAAKLEIHFMLTGRAGVACVIRRAFCQYSQTAINNTNPSVVPTSEVEAN